MGARALTAGVSGTRGDCWDLGLAPVLAEAKQRLAGRSGLSRWV